LARSTPLEIQELEYLQEQEETKSAVLGKDMNSTMEEMMEKKLTERFDQMEAEWEHKASNEAVQISEQVDMMTQLEHKVSIQAGEVFKIIMEAATTLTACSVWMWVFDNVSIKVRVLHV
jgi:hypothetical protein